MSWLRNSQLRASFSKRRQSNSPPKECDPTACYNSFRKHWQQTREIIDSTQPPTGYPLQDDVIGVVNHLDQMVTLLLVELRAADVSLSNSENRQLSPCLDYMLSENLLDYFFTWSVHTGRYCNTLRLEQLKLYEILVSSSRRLLLVHEPLLRPLLRLLASCIGECFPVEVEKRLVVLLNQLCVSLMQNIELLDLFFYASSDQGPTKFVIFTLLIPFVHHEGGIGQQARDALLLCMSLSKKNEAVGVYIAEHSNVCPVLATGLSGLYSRLPRKMMIEAEDWHRLTPDDVNEIPELTMFMNSLEFCNAVVQVAHPLVRQQMLEFLQQGFLVPVLGSALLQDSLGFTVDCLDSPEEVSTMEELVTATAYLDLFLRSVTEPGLLYSFIRFLLEYKYDGVTVLDSLIQRIATKSRLCLVTLALLETLVDLNCEDIMLELVLKHLVPCSHVMLSQRRRVRDLSQYCLSAARFLSLSPACCCAGAVPSPSIPHTQLYRPHLDTPYNSLPPYGLRTGESLYGNYHAYLCDARKKIAACRVACKSWTYQYDGENPPHDIIKPIECASELSDKNEGKIECDSVVDRDKSTENKLDEKQHISVLSDKVDNVSQNERISDVNNCSNTNNNSLVSVEESSGYESFPLRDFPESTFGSVKPDTESQRTFILHQNNSVRHGRKSSREYSNSDFFKTTPDIGPFLDAILHKLESMPTNGLYVNLHLTGLISRLAVYPQPLLHSFLLNHSLVFQPSIRSLFQVLGSLKHKIDQQLSRQRYCVDDLVGQAQDYLLGREDKLMNARRFAASRRGSLSSDVFSRGEPKRRSFTSTLSSVFRRATQHNNQQPIRENHLESPMQKTGFSLWSYSRGVETHSMVMTAVVLDEWLKELAAITQEQAMASLEEDFS